MALCVSVASTASLCSAVNFAVTNWGLISLIAAILPVVGMFFAAFLIPESPPWLIRKNRYSEAKINLCKIFGTKHYIPEVRNEIETLINNRGIKSAASKPLLEQAIQKVRYLVKPNCLKPLYLITTFFFFQQFAGTFVLVFYAIDIVKAAGITVDPYLTIVLIGITRLIGAMIVSYISKIYGRRPLSIISGSGMTISMACLAAYIFAQQQGKVLQGSFVFIPMISLLFYFFISSLGFLPMPFAMSAELFPAKIRGTSSGLATGTGYFFNFITVKVYNLMTENIGCYGIFFFYGILSLTGTLFVMWLLPETKGKTLTEIEEYFRTKQDEKNVLLQKPKNEA